MKRSETESFIYSIARKSLNGIGRFHRNLTRRFRILPDFIIIGAQRCGTTSLHRYLEQHPCISPVPIKEIHFFDFHYPKGTLWYRSFFPTSLYRQLITRWAKQRHAVGEASPYYFFHPLVPERVFCMLPNVKLIVLLRDPAERAFSHYHHEVKMGCEDATFEEALELEEKRLEGEKEKVLADGAYLSYALLHYSYLARGIYIDQLKAWRAFFPKEQLLVLKSEDLYTNASDVFSSVLDFLDLPDWMPARFPSFNKGDRPDMDTGIRKQLMEYYRPHNEALYRYLGQRFAWEE